MIELKDMEGLTFCVLPYKMPKIFASDTDVKIARTNVCSFAIGFLQTMQESARTILLSVQS